MRTQSWRALAVAAVGLFAGIEAQTGSLQDLGSLLADQKNLTTFYSLIKVCTRYAEELGFQKASTNSCIEIPRHSAEIALSIWCHCKFPASTVTCKGRQLNN